MGKLTVDLSDIPLQRLTAFAEIEGRTVEALAAECLQDLAASPRVRQAILKAKGAMAMAYFGWLHGYSGQALDQLLSFEEHESSFEILVTLEQAIEHKLATRGFGHRTGVEATILAVMALQREVNNGGYDQFFRNASKRYAMGITDCLTRIGCKEGTRITRSALAALKLKSGWRFEDLDQAMNTTNARRDQKLQECDERFWKLIDIPALLLQYAKAHSTGILT